jgi:hypothetical protein
MLPLLLYVGVGGALGMYVGTWACVTWIIAAPVLLGVGWFIARVQDERRP